VLEIRVLEIAVASQTIVIIIVILILIFSPLYSLPFAVLQLQLHFAVLAIGYNWLSPIGYSLLFANVTVTL
jgi:hypothetical protein